MPLVHPPEEHTEVGERHQRARKIKPQLAAGEPVSVARASNQAEAELISGLLLEEGVPSLIRRTAGFDVPDFLAAGPRDILVPQAAEDAARELLSAAGFEAGGTQSPRVPAGRLLAGLLIALALGALVIWLLSVLIR
jgi:Putative prokaryotic signal transducing protein